MEEGILGHWCTRGREQAGPGEVSSHRFPHHSTQRSCRCTPPTTNVTGYTAAGTHVAAPAGSQRDVGGAGRKGGGAQKGMGGGRGGGEEAAGEGGTDDGGGSRGNRGAGKATGHPGERRGAGSREAAARMGRCSEEAAEGGKGKAGQRMARGAGAGDEGTESCPPLQPFRQPGIPPEAEREVHKWAWKRIRGDAARLEEVAERERRVREEEAEVAREGHRLIPDPGRDNPLTDREGRVPSEKRAREEGDNGVHAGRKQRRLEERGAGGATGAPRPASPGPEPTPTDWRSASPLLRLFARHPAQREQEIVRGWRAGEVAELFCYVKWARRTRGGRERPGTHWFRDLVYRAGSRRTGGGRWRKTGGGGCWGGALPGVDLDGLRRGGGRPRLQMLTKLLQRDGGY